MAYGDFSLDRLTADFEVKISGAKLVASVAPLPPSVWLTEALLVASETGFGSEKSRSERLVSPVLLELARRKANEFAVIPGASLDIDPARGLNGECDFVLLFSSLQGFIKAPVFCITEARKQDIAYGTVQCAARLNERDEKPIKTLYGCSTTGVEWRFIRFEANEFVFDETRYLTSDPGKLLGILQSVIDQARTAANA